MTVLTSAFNSSRFTSSINWYRNVDRDWHLLADADPEIRQPALMVYGARDLVATDERITDFVPNVHEVELDCGHWIMEEMPAETNRVILEWLEQQGTS